MRRWIIFFILQFVFRAGVAQTTVTIDDSVDERDLMAKDLEMFIDSTSQIAFSEITTPPYAGKFASNPGYQNTDFRENSAYWIRVPIRHTPYSKKVWLLEFYDQTIDHIDAYVPREDGTYEKISMGDQQSFSKRLLKHKNFEVVLRMQADTVVNYYFRVQSHEFADIRVGVRSVNRFVFYALNEYFLFGTLYGMVIIIALYNFLVFLAIREIKNIYYIMYILSVASYAMSYDGIGFQYLWPNHPEWNNYAVGFTLYSVILWGLIFTRRFLVTRANAPKLDRALYWMIIIRSVYFLFEVFLFRNYLPSEQLKLSRCL